MRWSVLVLLLLFALPAAATDAATSCVDAALAAERAWALPSDLIHAIGRVESGRFDHATGQVTPWPWTVNANGSGFWFASRDQAVDFVRALQARGVRMIDVGCFQVDLFYHPTAFSSLEQAFDPSANADYAARFLTVLHGRIGDWAGAIAGYHSGLAQEGESYRQKVMAQWGAQWRAQWGAQWGLAAGFSRAIAQPPGNSIGRPPATDRYVIMMSAAARAIRVIGP